MKRFRYADRMVEVDEHGEFRIHPPGTAIAAQHRLPKDLRPVVAARLEAKKTREDR